MCYLCQDGIVGNVYPEEVGSVDGHPIVLKMYPAVSIQTILNCDPAGLFAFTTAKEDDRFGHGIDPTGHPDTFGPAEPDNPIDPCGPTGAVFVQSVTVLLVPLAPAGAVTEDVVAYEAVNTEIVANSGLLPDVAAKE